MTTKDGTIVALKCLGFNGLSGAHIAATTSFEAFATLMHDQAYDVPTCKRVFKELKRQGMIEIQREQGGYRIGLSVKAGHKLLVVAANEVKIPKMMKWDSKWRLVCFDIPRSKSSERMYLYRRLRELGFTLIQHSMWLHPFDCLDQIKQITEYIQLTKYVSVLEVTKLDERTTRLMLRKYESLLNT